MKGGADGGRDNGNIASAIAIMGWWTTSQCCGAI